MEPYRNMSRSFKAYVNHTEGKGGGGSLNIPYTITTYWNKGTVHNTVIKMYSGTQYESDATPPCGVTDELR